MKRAIVTIGLVLILLCGAANALESKNFNSDGNIMPGEQWGTVQLFDTPPAHTTVNMTGGEVQTMFTYDASILNMTGGRIYNLTSFEYSTVSISSEIFSDLTARDNSFVTFSGGAEALNVNALFSARINLTGGVINGLNAYDEGIVNIYAGDIGAVWTEENSVVNVFGYEIWKIPTGGSYGYGFVHGIYNDQSSFYFDLRNPDAYSHVNLIPEPATILLLVVGGLFLRKKD